jgi:hypothetical protein
MNQPSTSLLCSFCPHPAHPDQKCAACNCKGKKRFWRTLLDSLGNAIGQAKFGN